MSLPVVLRDEAQAEFDEAFDYYEGQKPGLGLNGPGETAMPVSIEALGIDRLTVRERLALIERIWDSLPEHVNPDEVPEWHLAELAKRRAKADASPRVGKPWREALERFGPLS